MDRVSFSAPRKKQSKRTAFFVVQNEDSHEATPLAPPRGWGCKYNSREMPTRSVGAIAVGYNCVDCEWREKVSAFSLFFIADCQKLSKGKKFTLKHTLPYRYTYQA